MKRLKLIGIGGGLLLASAAFAGGDHAGGHGHGDAHGGGGHGAAGGHRHDSWVSPPPEYSGIKWDKWDDKMIAARGEQLYQQQCASCHGESGKGDGPVAAGLPHQPADLTNHFHTAPGEGDGYLFWRISEGGQVAPFKDMQSAMPPFKHLSEDDRWAILTFVHQRFHGGFPPKHMAENEAHGHGEEGHGHGH